MLSFVLYSLASKEDVYCKPFTVHWMGQLSVVPRSSGNPCAVDCHTGFSTTNWKWRHCFSVQVRNTFLAVLARLTLQEGRGDKKTRHMKNGVHETERIIMSSWEILFVVICFTSLGSSRIPPH